MNQHSSLLPLKMASVCYQVGGRYLIDGMDLRIESQGITVVVGANGAGKSLMLRLVHGLLTPQSGQISWGGKPMDDALRMHQALVFQKPVLLRRTVVQNLRFVLELPKLQKNKSSMLNEDDLLAMVGLERHKAQFARSLSGGEQQRLALARALATEPSVLLLDEPTASLDPASIGIIENIVQKQCAEGVKVIFVTHDMAQAKRLADDVVFMSRGKVLENTAASVFFDEPVSQEARAYLAGNVL